MKFKKLGNTNLKVSLICLGTMTWGTQNSQKEAEARQYIREGGLSVDKLNRDRSATTKKTTSTRSREGSTWRNDENGDKEDISAIVAALRKPKMKGK